MTIRLPETERSNAQSGSSVIDPSEWTGDALQSCDDWIHQVSPEEIEDIDRAVGQIQIEGIDIQSISKDNFALPVFGKTLKTIRQQLLQGLGITLLRGFPIERYSRVQAAIAFFGIGAHLGRAVSQNAKGHILGHVKKLTDADYNKDARERGYRTNVDQRFHADSCDIVGLMVLQTPKAGGLSSIASTVAVHNAMLRQRPDLVQTLAGPIYWDRRGEVPPGKDPWYILPVFNYQDGWFSCRYARQYIDSTQRFDEVPRTTPEQKQAMDLFDQLLAELHMKMQFEIGDIQFLFNHVTLHGRTAFEDWPEPDRPRHLLRLWLSIDGERPLPPVLAERTQGGIVTAETNLHAPLEAE